MKGIREEGFKIGKRRLFGFGVDRHGLARPLFADERLRSFLYGGGKIFLKIYGNRNSSMIAINEVADYFNDYLYRRSGDMDAVGVEWVFCGNDLVNPERLYARLCYGKKIMGGRKGQCWVKKRVW